MNILIFHCRFDYYFIKVSIMASNSDVPDNTCDQGVAIIEEDLHCPPVLKEFFSNLCLNMEKNRWSSKCKNCSISISDTYKTTSNFLKHLKNKHQPIFDEWKSNNNNQLERDTNQPKINHIFSPDREKCKYFSCFKKRTKLFNCRFIKQQTTATTHYKYHSKSHNKHGPSIINCGSCVF